MQCTGQPFVVVGAKYQTIAELRGQNKLSAGVIFGSLTEALARELKVNLPQTIDVAFVGYQNSLQPTQDLLGGTLDLNVALPMDVMQWVENGKAHVIGISGTKDFANMKSFSNQGIRGFEELVANYHLLASAKTDPAVVQELHIILRKAIKDSSRLAALYKADYCTQVDVDLKTSNEMYNRWSRNWTNWLRKAN
jgi:tripartite-type tricarboxylate transporter receptor subunit TctC